MSLEGDSSTSSTWSLSTHLDGLEITELRGTLEQICAEPSDCVLIFSIDGIQQWTSFMWHEDVFFHFRASSIVKIELFSFNGTSAMITRKKDPLGSFTCRFIELLEDDVEIHIGSIRVKVNLGLVEGADLHGFVGQGSTTDGVIVALEDALTNIMDMMGGLMQSSDQTHKIKGQCHILCSVQKTWKPEISSYDHILELAKCLQDLCICGRDQLYKPARDIAKIAEASGKQAVQVASLIERLCLRENSWPDVEKDFIAAQARCEDLMNDLSLE